MNNPPDRPEPPQTPVPPLPPGFKLKPPAPQGPSSVIDLLSRRLEALERELGAEREKANDAQNMLRQQEALRGEVEAQLQTIHEQMRREKNERDSEERKSHSQGRIDELEKRLDGMHQTWASLLKDAIGGKGQQEGGGELAAMIKDLARAFDSRMADWERGRLLETERLEESSQALARERAAMRDALEAQHHAIREEQLKDRIGLESKLGEQLAALASRLDGLKASQDRGSAEAGELKEHFGKALAALNTPPKAKDQIIVNLEQENRELMKGLRERSESLRQYALERRQIELTMGASLVELTAELAAEREKQRQLQARQSGFDLEIAKLNDKLEAAAKTLLEKDERHAALSAERDGLARFLIAESAKVREQIEARRQAEEHWQKKVEELRKRLETESLSRFQDTALVAELQNQIGVLTGQMTKAMGEKDALTARYASWDKERQEILDALKKKEEMVSMLSTTFQNMLKKAP